MTLGQVVLGSGGVLGDTWMSGLIAGLLEGGGPDLRSANRFVGTSAGSIVATRLAAGLDLRDYLERRFGPDFRSWRLPREAGGLSGRDGSARAAATASVLLGSLRPAGGLLRRSVLKAVPEGGQELDRLGRSMDRLMTEWDPRLSLVGVDLNRGTRLVMDAGESSGLTVSKAVRASCAIPGVFRPVESERGPIIDGGVWSPVNLDAVRPEPGSTVLCLYPSGYYSKPRSARRSAVTGLSLARVAIEAAAVRRAGARVLTVSPDPGVAAVIGPDRMDHGRDAEVAAAAFQQGLGLSIRLRSMVEGYAVRGQGSA